MALELIETVIGRSRKPMNEKINTRVLPCKLNETEQILKSKELAAKNKEFDEVTAEKKAAAAEFSLKLKEISADIQGLSLIVATSTEHRPVEVRRYDNFEKFVVEHYRTDLGSLVESRPMTFEERQRRLFPGQVDEHIETSEQEEEAAYA